VQLQKIHFNNNFVYKIKTSQTNLNKTTAILLFSRTAHAEAQAKPLVFNDMKAEKVAALAIQQAKKTAIATRLPVFQISEKQQRGTNFGERLANAFQDIFNKGFDSVIAIGNDCLDISIKNLNYTAEKLLENPLVLGETHDGGVYILGLNQATFHQLDFSTIAWQTANVFQQLTHFAEKTGISPLFLDKKADFDTSFDFIKILETVSFRLKKLFLRLLKNIFPTLFYSDFRILNPLFLSPKSLRGPPVY
jgi:uncharacterized protein